MRNIISFVLGVLGGAALLVALLALMAANANAHEAHGIPGGGLPGAVHGINAVCTAKGASLVAQADLKSGDPMEGNRVFTALSNAKENKLCSWWVGPVPLQVWETAYVGEAKNGLHVYIVKFGRDMFSVMTSRPKTFDPRPSSDSV